jgi:DNA segregation ATPase FtsK/SpoIIIE-like protein
MSSMSPELLDLCIKAADTRHMSPGDIDTVCAGIRGWPDGRKLTWDAVVARVPHWTAGRTFSRQALQEETKPIRLVFNTKKAELKAKKEDLQKGRMPKKKRPALAEVNARQRIRIQDLERQVNQRDERLLLIVANVKDSGFDLRLLDRPLAPSGRQGPAARDQRKQVQETEQQEASQARAGRAPSGVPQTLPATVSPPTAPTQVMPDRLGSARNTYCS